MSSINDVITTRLVWMPLKEWYKRIYGRPSMFNTYVTCSHKYKYAPKFTSEQQKLGTYAHELLQDFKTGKVSYEQSYGKCYFNDFTAKEQKLLNEWLDLVVEDEKTLIAEFEWVLEIEMWNYLFVIPYHIDNVLASWLSDYKTSKALWNTDIEYNYQRICYSLWYYFHKYEFDRQMPMPFQFVILTKHARWARKQIVSWDNNWDEFIAWVEFDKLVDLLKKIVVSEWKDNYPSYTNYFCKSCPLYNKCPSFTSLPLY